MCGAPFFFFFFISTFIIYLLFFFFRLHPCRLQLGQVVSTPILSTPVTALAPTPRLPGRCTQAQAAVSNVCPGWCVYHASPFLYLFFFFVFFLFLFFSPCRPWSLRFVDPLPGSAQRMTVGRYAAASPPPSPPALKPSRPNEVTLPACHHQKSTWPRCTTQVLPPVAHPCSHLQTANSHLVL